MPTELPKPLISFMEKYQSNGASNAGCTDCASSCCRQGGFAILENVVLIYELYKQGGLKRTDYEYEPDLNFERFVKKYFDIWLVNSGGMGRRKTLTIFHVKSISSDGNLISIPGAKGYYETRAELFYANPWLNKGCVFLKDRGCLLHDPEYMKYVTAKPIHCVFYACEDALRAKIPTKQETHNFLTLLTRHFPDSKKRFEAMSLRLDPPPT